MERFTTEQRTRTIEFYYLNQRSIILTQRAYRRHFNVRISPSEAMIRCLVNRHHQHGSVRDLPRTGRPRLSRSAENIERVQQSVNEAPETSCRRRSAQLEMSRTSLRRILKKDLQLYPYKVQLVQELKPADLRQRLNFAVKFQELARNEINFIENLIMSDEAHFHLNGFVNKQNCRFWGSENPRAIHQRQLHPIRCTVWCGITSENVIGPYFFENEDGSAVTVNGERYRFMIENFLRPALENRPGMWFQQDGATAHTARDTMALLRQIFGERIISRNSEIFWPARSPDLTAPDYFLWGFLKERVYVNKPETILELKANIVAEIRTLQPQVLKDVMENALKRAHQCEAENGGHLRDIIFHT
jgi:hypothetical protein